MPGELVPHSDREIVLTKKQQAVAVLDALGWTRADICNEVAVDPSYVSRLRRNKAYRAFMNSLLAETDMVARLKTGILRLDEGAERAIETLIELLDATDSEGRPEKGVRTVAASKLLEQYTRALAAGMRAGSASEAGDDGVGRGASATITVNLIRGEDGSVQPIIDIGSEDVTDADR